MSFNDLERGESSQPLLRGGVPNEDRTFISLKDSCSIQIFKIQSNVQGIQRLVEKLGGAADGPTLRTSLHNLTEATRDMVKKSTEEVKKLALFPAGGEHGSRKPVQAKISKEFGAAIQAFQRVQKLSAEKQRSFVEVQKRRVDQMAEDVENQGESSGSPPGERGSLELGRVQQQSQINQTVSVQELDFQETLIAEREAEIRDIESGIHELNDIFRDLGTIVSEQGGLIDNIESNVTSVAQNTSSAAEELTTAHEYQRKAGRRMVCLLLILVVVILVILLAILS